MNILLAVDGSECSEAAIQALTTQAGAKDKNVLIMHVIEPLPLVYSGENWNYVVDWDKLRQERQREAEHLVEQGAKTLRSAGFTVTTAIEEGSPKSAIVDTAANWPADLLVLGSHGRKGLERFLLGSVSEGVARHAPCSVLIVRKRGG